MLPGCPESSDGGHHPPVSITEPPGWVEPSLKPPAVQLSALPPPPGQERGRGGNLAARHCHLRLLSRALPEESGYWLLCKILVYDEKENVEKEKAKIGHRDFKSKWQLGEY